MDNSADAIQELLASYIGKVITIESSRTGKVSGVLQRVGGGILVIKTDKGPKMCRASNIEEVDLPDDEAELEPVQMVINDHQKKPGGYTQPSPVQPSPAVEEPPSNITHIYTSSQSAMPVSQQSLVQISDSAEVAPVESPIPAAHETSPLQEQSEKPLSEPTVPTPPPSIEEAVVSNTSPELPTSIASRTQAVQNTAITVNSQIEQPGPPTFDPAVMRKLLQIEVQFDTRLQNARLELLAPDFTRPTDLKETEQKRLWERIQNRYTNAVRIQELAPRYGRIQNILQDFEALIELAPTSAIVRRYYAYLRYEFAKNIDEALNHYQEITYIAATVADWYNLAVLALLQDTTEGRRLAYYALGQVFKQASLLSYEEAWYSYTGLLRELDDYVPLSFIYQAALNRGISGQEEQLLLESCVYLLQANQKEALALQLVQHMHEGASMQQLLREISTKYFTAKEVHVYQPLHQQWEHNQYHFWEHLQPAPTLVPTPVSPSPSTIVWTSSPNGNGGTAPSELPRQLRGTIYKFDKSQRFGFLRERGENWQEYFFHRSSIADEYLLDELLDLPGEYPSVPIDVLFSATHGPRGPVALNISRHRDITQTFELAINYANDGEYEKANAQIKIVLAQNPDYPRARELYDNWREFARARGVPRGSTPYARAKRKQLIEKDLESAITLFREAIRQNDNTESAIKDLAALLMQLSRSKEAIEVLLEHRTKISDQQSVNNLLVDFYQKAGEYPQAITLLRKMLVLLPKTGVNRKAQIYWRIGTCYLGMEHYKDAEYWFREVLKLGSNNKAAQRNLALSLLRQGRDQDAEALLQANLPDTQSAELLDAIIKARETGQSVEIAPFDNEVTLADFSSEISNFARFFLDRCTYEGVDSQHRISKHFDRMDVRKLEELATRLGTRRPRERAEYYLSAAKIILENEDWEDEYNQLYKYLCRSFASRGDAAITENKPVDTAREWYCEALSVYDGDRGRSRDEQDAINAIVRFLLATISRSHVPFRTDGRGENLRIDEGLEQALRLYNQPEKMFHAIAYLVFRSQFAANRILSRLYTETDFQHMALSYLASQGILVPDGLVTQGRFSDLWKSLQLKDHERTRDIAVELHTVANRIDLTTVALEENLSRLRVVEQKLFFDQDRRQIDELQKILEAMLDLSQQTTFEEKERLCTQIEKRCQDVLAEIESAPTRFSVESIYPIVVSIKEKSAEYLERTYESSTPQLTLRLPKDMESYSPDVNTHRLEVQVVIENKIGCSPADAIELIIQEDSEFFTVEMPEIKLEGSLRGGDQRIKPVLIQVRELAMRSQAFTLPIYAQYRTRSGDTEQTQEVAFAINLYSANQFERVNNPYTAYASGHIVADEHMFYGRSELIRNIADAIGNVQEQSKGIVIFGQKRSGKSSILYHLKLYLRQHYNNLLVVDLGSVGAYLDETSSIPLLYQLLGGMLSQLRFAIEDEIEQGKRSSLSLSIPEDVQFYQHPTPLRYFQGILKEFKRVAARTASWQGIHLVLLLDEFSYLHGLIAQGRLPEAFMRNWKAILQEDLFSVVLAGQDVMPKFIDRFPNEFAAIKDQRISYLEPDEARKLIDEPLCIGGKSGESRYREKAIDRIVDLTAASPFYIQIFCDRLVEYMNRKRINLVTQADVEQVKNELITGANALVDGKFDNLISSGDASPDAIPEKEASAVLKAIANNSRTGPCSRDRILVETQTDVEDILQDLLAREVIEGKGQYYAIRVGLFKEWLLAH